MFIMGKHNSKLTKEELEDLQKATQSEYLSWAIPPDDCYPPPLPRQNRRATAPALQENLIEIKGRYKDFIDDCPSGYMTKEEFKQIYGQFFPSGDPTRFVDYVFNVFDIDKNGVITFKEFILAISITTKGTVEEKLTWSFSLYDFDNDGYVSRSEMLDIVRAIHRMHGKDTSNAGKDRDAAQRIVDQMFNKLDTNGDGKLSKEEFTKGFKNDPWIMRALLSKTPLHGLPPKDNDQRRRISTCPMMVPPEQG